MTIHDYNIGIDTFVGHMTHADFQLWALILILLGSLIVIIGNSADSQGWD